MRRLILIEGIMVLFSIASFAVTFHLSKNPLESLCFALDFITLVLIVSFIIARIISKIDILLLSAPIFTAMAVICFTFGNLAVAGVNLNSVLILPTPFSLLEKLLVAFRENFVGTFFIFSSFIIAPILIFLFIFLLILYGGPSLNEEITKKERKLAGLSLWVEAGLIVLGLSLSLSLL